MGMLENQWRSDQRNQATFPRAWCIRLNCHRCYEIYVYMGLCKDSQLQGANTENFRGKAEPAKWYAPAATMPMAHEVLDFLKEKFEIHIITNGFKEIQTRKTDLKCKIFSQKLRRVPFR